MVQVVEAVHTVAVVTELTVCKAVTVSAGLKKVHFINWHFPIKERRERRIKCAGCWSTRTVWDTVTWCSCKAFVVWTPSPMVINWKIANKLHYYYLHNFTIMWQTNIHMTRNKNNTISDLLEYRKKHKYGYLMILLIDVLNTMDIYT